MAATSFFQTQPQLRNSTLSGIECFGRQLIVFTPPAAALCTGRPRYHPFLVSPNTAVGHLPSAWSAPLWNSIVPPPGYPSLCPPGTRDVLRTNIACSSKALPKPSTLLHGFPRRLSPPSTWHETPYVTKFQTSLRKSLSSCSPRPIL